MPRTVIIGDVHGCLDELQRLLDRVLPDADDRVFFVGDLLARGPDSLGVLALCRRLGARSVRGNHEVRLLRARRASLEGGKRPRLSQVHYPLFRRLGDEDWAFLESLPLSIALEAHELVIVHAGVLPGVELAAQDAWTLTHVRGLDAEGRPSARSDQRPWAESYSDGPHVVFGHNSRAGLGLFPNATCIDSGCVYGGRLTALVLEADERVPRDPRERAERLVSVPARRAYYAGRP